MKEGIRNFLVRLGLDRYYDIFVTKGFDSEGDLAYLDRNDLDAMYIVDENDRRTILQSAPIYKHSKEYVLFEWLRSRGLDYYFISFVQSELIDLAEIGRLNLPDEDLYDELEITLPGHRKRLERAVRDLSKKLRSEVPAMPCMAKSKPGQASNLSQSQQEQEVEIPVAYGRWGKPHCLSDAKFDFLIIDATVLSTTDPRDKVDLEFMVDSGSDVVTIRQEVLDTMDLELIGPIQSKGVHASRRKNLYKANLQIGNEILEIEVMGESYDSVGSQVVRHFRHFINRDSHVWMKGDHSNKSSQALEHIPTLPSSQAVPSSVQDQTGNQNQESEKAMVVESSPLADRFEGEMEEEEVAPTDSALHDNKMQKDYVNIQTKKNGDITAIHENVKVENVKINFDFKKSEKEEANENEISETKEFDEPDKLINDGSVTDIIDVRPMIAANRKRHANDVLGFDPNSLTMQTQKKLKVHHSGNTMRAINANNNNLVSRMESMNVQTVLKSRAVYYRAQVPVTDGEGI